MNENEAMVPQVVSGGMSALESMENAQINQQITTAKKYPRDLASVKRRMQEFATLDADTAASCFYVLPRDGKTIQGPSIRMAEIAVCTYGNLRIASRLIETVTSGDQPHVVVQAVCHDLESNVAVSIEKRRRINAKKKNNGRIDADDINLAANGCAAIAFRDACFKIVPGALVKPIVDLAKKCAIGDAKTIEVRRAGAIERFAKMGVDQSRVLACVGRKAVGDITLDDLETLVGLFTAIKDGQTTIEESFPVVPAAAKPLKMAGKAPESPKDESKAEDAAPVASEPSDQSLAQKAASFDQTAKQIDDEQIAEIVAKLTGYKTNKPVKFTKVCENMGVPVDSFAMCALTTLKTILSNFEQKREI